MREKGKRITVEGFFPHSQWEKLSLKRKSLKTGTWNNGKINKGVGWQWEWEWISPKKKDGKIALEKVSSL